VGCLPLWLVGTRIAMTATEVGESALFGWREKAASGVAGPLSQRTPLDEEQVRAVVGALFFALAAYYVVGTLRRAISTARD
jgi:hypothetical protein